MANFTLYTLADLKREARSLCKMKPKGKLKSWAIRVHATGSTLVVTLQPSEATAAEIERGMAL